MLPRSWIAVLLLINYLLVVGLGCVSRPEDQHELVLVQTDVNGQYQQCRYMRMDGLEKFLNEALASRYQNAPETPRHHLISVVSGVDAHYLPTSIGLRLMGVDQLAPPTVTAPVRISGAIRPTIDAPPWLG